MELIEFDHINDFKKLAHILSKELADNGLVLESNEVSAFKTNSFGTTSEYLGEFRIVLKSVIGIGYNFLNDVTVENAKQAITAINSIFAD